MGSSGDISVKQPAGDRRFAAFISYSHVDAVAASKLQRKLERYRLPKRIADTRGQGRLLGSIFRDREDLAAASSLTSAIRNAIAQADSLIVICSPDAAASPWVAAEIELFREVHPDRAILAAILSGEPSAAFPPALTAGGLEPLAADLRPEGDGTQLGFLKIVAGMAGVPLDALIQRDAQRRIRRVTAITVGALAAVLIMGVMTAFALQARNEAARQRSEAEGLVEYMLTDLREKLRGVNRLDVMKNVNARAMRYYGNRRSIAGLSDESLERRSRLLHAMGEDDLQSGNFTDALVKFAEAHKTTEKVLENNRESTAAIFAHAQSEYWLGYTAFRLGQAGKTLVHFVAYKKFADQLSALEPENPEWQREAGYANGNLCSHHLDTSSDVGLAVNFCRSALKNVERYAAWEQGSQSAKIDLANRYAWLSDALFKAGDIDEAWDFRKRQLSLLTILKSAEPDNADYRLQWIQYHIAIAKFPQMRRDLQLSASKRSEANTELRSLIANDPENKDTLSYLAKLNDAYAFLTPK